MNKLFYLKTASIFFVVIFSCVNANSGAFTESAAASTSSSGLASTQTTVAIANIAITGQQLLGTQIYESGGLATIGVVPEKIKNLSPLAYIKDEKFLPNNPKLNTCQETLDIINLQNSGSENNKQNSFLTEGCSISIKINSFGDKKMSAIKYLEE